MVVAMEKKTKSNGQNLLGKRKPKARSFYYYYFFLGRSNPEVIYRESKIDRSLFLFFCDKSNCNVVSFRGIH